MLKLRSEQIYFDNVVQIISEGHSIEIRFGDHSVVLFNESEEKGMGDDWLLLSEHYATEGMLKLNKELFKYLFPAKHPDSVSQMKNVAKGFFKFNSKKHFCLVQYMEPNSSSSEHYHGDDEYIIAIRGNPHVSLTCSMDRTKKHTHVMKPGELMRIPAYVYHRLYNLDTDSITIPVKEMPKKKQGHYFRNSEGHSKDNKGEKK